MTWHSEKLETVFEKLDSSEDGLSDQEAEARLEEKGRNEIRSDESVSPVKIFLSQFQDFLIYLLIIAALMSIGVGFLPGEEVQYTEAGLIFAILIANGVFGFIQDYKAEKSIKALKDLSTPEATVMRDGKKITIDSRDIVPGDVIFLEQGDSIPADARIVESESLATDESALTGESTNVSKREGVLEEDKSIADRENMVFMNTSVVKGRGKAVVVETGMETEVGDIADQISEAEDKETPFQKEVDELGKKIGYGIMAIITIVAMTQAAFTSASPVTIVLVAITLAVAAVPEGLPAVVTLTLALGSKKMLKKDALVRRLPVVESLGSVDVIVTDKTGTLTEDRMTVKKIHFQGENFEVTGTGYSKEGKFQKDGHETDPEYLKPLLETGAICNNAEKAPEKEETKYYGEPTEIALLVSAKKAGVTPDKNRIREIPFSSDRKRMTAITEDQKAYTKGAPEVILERCDRYLDDGEVKELNEEKRQEILENNQEMAQEALRVLGFARKELEDTEAPEEEIENNMVFVGLQGMIDPAREEVEKAVSDCREAGIKVVMATGDNIETAKAIGEDIGFNPEGAMQGPEIEKLDDEELREKVSEVEIFARVSPEHKVRILKALQDNGHNVAMTGDGVNDAPALKNSDVGISMGKRGTDVAKQSSDMVLQDDNFVTIRDAIAEGRGIFDNIRKFVNYLLSANLGEVLVIFLGVILGSLFFPGTFQSSEKAALLTPIMLLWINFVTDGLPALALGADPKSDGIMNRKPRGKDEPVINKRILGSIGAVGLIISTVGLGLYFYLLSVATQIIASTALFTFVVAIEMARIQIIRRRYDQKISSNKWLMASLIFSLVLQAAVLYTPLQGMFGVEPLGLQGLSAIGAGILAFIGLSIVTSKTLDNLIQ